MFTSCQIKITPCSPRFISNMQVNGSPKTFRYEVIAKTKGMVFTPKKLALGDSENVMSVRGTMLGASFAENYKQLPKTDVARTLWEALWFSSDFARR